MMEANTARPGDRVSHPARELRKAPQSRPCLLRYLGVARYRGGQGAGRRAPGCRIDKAQGGLEGVDRLLPQGQEVHVHKVVLS